MCQNYIFQQDNYNEILQTEKNVLIDTNVLIKLLYPNRLDEENTNPTEEKKSDFVSKVYIDMLKTKRLVTISPIIGEFYNFCVNNSYELYLKSKKLSRKDFSKKRYRDESDFSKQKTNIINMINTIYKQSKFVESTFDFKESKVNKKILNKLDFTDLMIADFCSQNNVVLLTLDNDFKKLAKNIREFDMITYVV